MSKINTRATINANIKQNGNQEITGQVLNSVLNTMVDDYAEQEKLTELESQVIYDVTANNADAKFASLSALLSSENLSTLIPAEVRCGGMSIRFVQSSDNKYAQFRYMSSSTSVADFTNVDNWQGVVSEAVAGSKDMIDSNGVYILANNEKRYINKQIPNLKFLREIYIENATEDLYIILFGKQNGVRMLQIAGSSTIYCTIYDTSEKSGYHKFVKNGTIIHIIVDYANMPGQTYYPSYNKDDNVKLLDAAYNKIYSPTIQQILTNEEIKGNITLLSENKADLIVGKNLFDKNAIIEGKYVSVTGELGIADNCAVSKIIPVVGGETYYLYRGHNKIDAYTAMFLDANGESLTPLDIDGNAYPEYSPGESGVVKAPSNAIGFQFTCKFNGTGDINITQLEIGSEYTGYESYKKTVPETQIPSPLKGKLIAYNGDSICESRFSGSMANGGSYPAIIADIVGGSYNNRAISGGILASQTGNGTTPARFVCLDVVNMPADADLICFEGGINDYWTNVPLGDFSPSDYSTTVDTTTVCGAVESILRQAINKWVGKRIVFIIVHKIRHTAFSQNQAGYTFEELHDKIVAICNKYSIPYFDAWKDGGLNTYISSLSEAYTLKGSGEYGDTVHPNEDGYKKYYVPQLISLFDSLIEK